MAFQVKSVLLCIPFKAHCRLTAPGIRCTYIFILAILHQPLLTFGAPIVTFTTGVWPRQRALGDQRSGIRNCSSLLIIAALSIASALSRIRRRVAIVGSWRRWRLFGRGRSRTGPSGVGAKIHIGFVFVGRLVVTVIDVVLRLRLAPCRVVAFVFHAFADGKRGNTDATEAEMVGAVIMAGLWTGIGANSKLNSLAVSSTVG